MPIYFYQGFEIEYSIEQPQESTKMCCSKGVILRNPGWSTSSSFQQFQTEASTIMEAELEIKRLINKYIDFEWNKYLEFQGNL